MKALLFESVSKRYRLGSGTGSLRQALASLPRLLTREANLLGSTDDLWALQDVSFELTAGQSLGLLGPNGAGKTTILRLLAGVSRPTSGRVAVSGRVSALIELGAGFHPDLTGRENVYLNAAILGLSRKEVDRVFDRIVAFSGLARFMDTPVKRYSSGMYVRLGFAIAAHIEPDVLLVDEVLAVGDAQFRHKCSQRIRELKERGTTIVFVSHNLHLVNSICDTALFLAGGQVQAQGDVVSTIRAYQKWQREVQERDAAQNQLTQVYSDPGTVVEIKQVEVCGLNGIQAGPFRHTDAVQFRIHFETSETIRKPNLVVRIMRADGITCCELRARDLGYNLCDLRGHGAISLTIDPLQLTEGVYTAHVQIQGAFDGVGLAEGYSPWFQVDGLGWSPAESRGVFTPNLRWFRLEPGSGQAECDLTATLPN